jgi:hypothetical protein
MLGGGFPCESNGVCGVMGGFMVLPPQRRQFPAGPVDIDVDADWVVPLRPSLLG